MNAFVRRSPLPILRLLLSIVGLLAVQAVQVSQAQSVATNPVGYNVFNLPAGGSFRVNTFVQPTAYQSTMASYTNATNSVVTISSSGSSLTSGSFAETGAEPSYYLEVLSGSSTGLIVDVLANTTSTITVNANLSSFSVSGTSSFCVRPHTTLSSLFPATSGLAAYVDTVKLFFPDNSSQLFTFTGSGDGWIGTGGDAGSQIIYPGQGFIVTVQSPKSVSVMGSVKPGPTIVPLYAGAINLVGTINPMLSGTQTLSTFGFPTLFSPYVDSAKLFYDDGSVQSPGTYLSNGSIMIDGTGGNANSVSVNPSNAVIVTVQQNKYWVMPSFYTSGN
jgi:hypothetical protein